jgi:hypothetical protein
MNVVTGIKQKSPRPWKHTFSQLIGTLARLAINCQRQWQPVCIVHGKRVGDRFCRKGKTMKIEGVAFQRLLGVPENLAPVLTDLRPFA